MSLNLKSVDSFLWLPTKQMSCGDNKLAAFGIEFLTTMQSTKLPVHHFFCKGGNTLNSPRVSSLRSVSNR